MISLQSQVIENAKNDESKRKEICDKIGLKLEDYSTLEEKLVEMRDHFTTKASKRYSLKEIASSTSGGPRKIDPIAAKKAPQYKIKAQINQIVSAHNEFQEIVEWQKFETLRPLFEEHVADESLPFESLVTFLYQFMRRAEDTDDKERVSYAETTARPGNLKLLMVSDLFIAGLTRLVKQINFEEYIENLRNINRDYDYLKVS